MTGLPNLQFDDQGLAYTDSYAVDLFGNLLENDPLGADIEGIAVAADGSYWGVDEYRPSIYHFDKKGKLLDRFIPFGAPTDNGEYGTPALPSVYAMRQPNKGFEAVAMEGDMLYAFIQSPIDNPNTKKNPVGTSSKNIRILAFNTTSQSTVAEYIYVLDDDPLLNKVDKISDATSLGDSKFLVLERDASAKNTSYKLVYEVDIKGATNVNNPENFESIPLNQTIEEVLLSTTNIIPVNKTLVINVMSLGWSSDNIEGLTVINGSTIAVVSDNDYQLNSDMDVAGDGTVLFDRQKFTMFGVITNLNFSAPTSPIIIPPKPKDEDGVGLTAKVIIGIVVGIVGCIVLIIGSILIWKKRLIFLRPFSKLKQSGI